MNPFFSILIPSYNRPEYIHKLIDSIINGRFENFEIIISDDCSPKKDEIKNIVNKYLSDDNRIRFYEQVNNLGEVGSKNFLVSKAKGSYNIIIGDDDIFIDNALYKLHQSILNNPNHDLYAFGYETIDENGKKISTYKSPKDISFSIKNFERSSNILYADMLPLWIFHPSTFCCKAGIEKSIGYSSEVGMAEDIFFIFELLLQEKEIFVISDEVFKWRKILYQSKSDQLNQSSEYLADISARLKIFEKLLTNSNYEQYSSFFRSRDFIYRFLVKNVLSDGRIDFKNFNTLLPNKTNVNYNKVNEVFDHEIKKSNFIIYVNKIFLLPRRLFIFNKLFGFKSTLLFLYRLISLKKIIYKISLKK